MGRMKRRCMMGRKSKAYWLQTLFFTSIIFFYTQNVQNSSISLATCVVHCENFRLPRRPEEKLKLLIPTSPVTRNSAQVAKAVWCQFTNQTLSYFTVEMFKDRANFIGNSDKTVLIVDDRESVVYWWTIPWTLNMLGPEWSMQIFASPNNIRLFKEIIAHFDIENVHVDTLEERYGSSSILSAKWRHEVHFMLSKQFWQGVRGETILIVQDHAVPTRRWNSIYAKRILDEVYKYAYVGAPWSLKLSKQRGPYSDINSALESRKYYSHLSDWKKDPGGNGGFSLRKRSWMIEYGVDLEITSFALLSSDSKLLDSLGSENEDWLWGKLLAAVPYGVAPKVLEHKFAVETLRHKEQPLGVHNYGAFHSVQEMINLVQSASKEFFVTNEDVFTVLQGRYQPAASTLLFQPFSVRSSSFSYPSECALLIEEQKS